MLNRCYDERDAGYPNYGARGIVVCDRWRESFSNFLEDMGERPSGMTLDRFDNDKPYSKENCRWATKRQQIRNRRITWRIEYQRQTKPVAEWAEIVGIDYYVLKDRLRKGWPVEKAMSQPVRH